MRLFRVKTRFLGKDLDKTVLLGYLVAMTDDEVFEEISKQHCSGAWAGNKEGYEGDPDELAYIDTKKQEIVEARGDFDQENDGEFYDKKYGWEDLGEVSEEDIATLKRLGILGIKTAPAQED
jgi:hypothetical protein